MSSSSYESFYMVPKSFYNTCLTQGDRAVKEAAASITIRQLNNITDCIRPIINSNDSHKNVSSSMVGGGGNDEGKYNDITKVDLQNGCTGNVNLGQIKPGDIGGGGVNLGQTVREKSYVSPQMKDIGTTVLPSLRNVGTSTNTILPASIPSMRDANTSTNTVLPPSMRDVNTNTVLPPSMRDVDTNTLLPPFMKTTGTMVLPSMRDASTTILSPSMQDTGSNTILPPSMRDVDTNTILPPSMINAGTTAVLPSMRDASSTIFSPSTMRDASTTVFPSMQDASTNAVSSMQDASTNAVSSMQDAESNTPPAPLPPVMRDVSIETYSPRMRDASSETYLSRIDNVSTQTPLSRINTSGQSKCTQTLSTGDCTQADVSNNTNLVPTSLSESNANFIYKLKRKVDEMNKQKLLELAKKKSQSTLLSTPSSHRKRRGKRTTLIDRRNQFSPPTPVTTASDLGEGTSGLQRSLGGGEKGKEVVKQSRYRALAETDSDEDDDGDKIMRESEDYQAPTTVPRWIFEKGENIYSARKRVVNKGGKTAKVARKAKVVLGRKTFKNDKRIKNKNFKKKGKRKQISKEDLSEALGNALPKKKQISKEALSEAIRSVVGNMEKNIDQDKEEEKEDPTWIPTTRSGVKRRNIPDIKRTGPKKKKDKKE
jgi:hypothetical protein